MSRRACTAAFTLVEVLVVCAAVAVLLGLLVPVLSRARAAARRCGCQANLRQIWMAWDLYLTDSGGRFFRGQNHNFDFGGWQGYGPYAAVRPLNRYAGLPVDGASRPQARVFRCPDDQGGQDYPEKAYDFFGNSLQANTLLTGPVGLPTPEWVPEPIRAINQELNRYTAGLTRATLADPSRLAFLGDRNWVSQWAPGDLASAGEVGTAERTGTTSRSWTATRR
jgi:type II secretory pathway pseudopilin PulG